MSQKITYFCDICEKQMEGECYTTEEDTKEFGLEPNTDICIDCYTTVVEFIKSLKVVAKLTK
jgi:hypothetical protein